MTFFVSNDNDGEGGRGTLCEVWTANIVAT